VITDNLIRYKPILSSQTVFNCGYDCEYEPCVCMVSDPTGDYVKVSDLRKAEGFDNTETTYWGS
jgi:hypothetical protein